MTQGHNLSPYELEILIHYYSKVGEFPNQDNEAFQAAIRRFVNAGLIKINGPTSSYRGNHEALQVFFDKVLSTPLPANRWVMPAN